MENENEKNQDNETQENELENENGNMKSWLQENLRIIVSVLIVITIAAGVYSYSKRSQNPAEENQLGMTSSISEESVSPSEETGSEIGSAAATENQSQEKKEQPAQIQKEDSVSSEASSQETQGSFIETAGKGDGLTHLARRSLANYLEKNSDSTLTAEHKIYIEDYLRKNVGHNQGVKIGTSVEFSKQLIENAIAKSKTLNEKQLQNLHKYAVRVPSLS